MLKLFTATLFCLALAASLSACNTNGGIAAGTALNPTMAPTATPTASPTPSPTPTPAAIRRSNQRRPAKP